VEGVERPGQGVEGARPRHGELLVHQALGAGRVAQPGEPVVVPAEVAGAAAFELVGEPLPAVEADLDGEREPRLEAGVEEPEDAVAVVLVDVEALPRPEPEAAFMRIRRAVVLEAHAGLEGLERADQAFVHRVFGKQASCEGLLVDGAGLQVAHGAVVVDRFPERGGLDAFTRGQDVGLEVQEGDIGAGQEGVHASLHDQRQEGPAKHEAVEPGQHGGDERAVTGNKALHRLALALQAGWWPAASVREQYRFQSWVAGGSPR
jgi:hypothetical protein